MSSAYLPPALLRSLARVPSAPAAVLMRHAHRGPLLPGAAGDNTTITDEGERAAEALGRHLLDRIPGRVVASPALRCLQTARAVCRGAGWHTTGDPVEDHRLHGIGALVADPEQAFREFRGLGVDGMIRRLLVERSGIPGFYTPAQTAARVVGATLEHLDQGEPASAPRLDLLVSHDIVIAVSLHALVGTAFSGEHDLPAFLEGLIVWRIGDARVALAWDGEVRELDWPI